MFKKNHIYNIHKFNCKSLICLVALLSLLMGGTIINDATMNVSAHTKTYRRSNIRHHRYIHHYYTRHTRRHRTYRNHRYHRKYHRDYKEFARIHRAYHNRANNSAKRYKENAFANDGNNEFARETAHDIFDQINAERKQNGLKPLSINVDAQRVANERNSQVYNAYTHYDEYKNYAVNHNNGNPSNNWIHGVDLNQTSDDDARKLNISDNEGTAENAGNVYVKGATKYAGGSKIYNVTDPHSDAYANIDNMTNDDSYSGWGHRENILDKEATGIGVASYYNPQTNYSTNVEDFSYGNNPQDI